MPELSAMETGAVRWAWEQARKHVGQFLVSVVLVGGVFDALSALKVAWPVALGISAVVGFAVTFVFALLFAPLQQRNALRRTMQAALDEVDPYCLELENFEIEVWEAVHPDKATPDELVVAPIFRNRLTAPLAFRMESFTQTIGQGVSLRVAPSEVVTLPPGQARSFRVQKARFGIFARDFHQIEVEYSMLYWRLGLPKRFRRKHRALVDYRPRADSLHGWISPPPYSDVSLEVTELRDGE